MNAERWLNGMLKLPDGATAFPWQWALVERLRQGDVPRALDIPTGLGKTATIAAWLVALASGGAVPRRLVYVVDRRAVVDQATEFAEHLRSYVTANPDLQTALGLASDQALPISTLRGQFADNRDWLADPSAPAIIVGTVDMVGSRLLFSGYGVSRKMRPYQAGLLGVDALIVLDESHLVPPFEQLLDAIAADRTQFIAPDEQRRGVVRQLRLLALSATGHGGPHVPTGLTDADLAHPVVKQRLDAVKRLTTVDLGDAELSAELAKHAWGLTGNGMKPCRIIVFCNSRDTADATRNLIAKLAAGKADTELFVGERRVHERVAAATWLRERGFIAGSAVVLEKPAFVIATSAGEVGVDLDADHMVSDLVAWERMVQRLGRVNRRGNGNANVVVILEPDAQPDKKTAAALDVKEEDREDEEHVLVRKYEHTAGRGQARRSALALLADGDASPGALRVLKLRAASDLALQKILLDATTPSPLRPALSRPIVDSWSLTSLRDDPSRPDVAPWLRGFVDDEPQTTIVWRALMPDRADAKEAELAEFFEAAPAVLEETLDAPTDTVVKWLLARANAVHASDGDDPELAAVVLKDDGTVAEWYSTHELAMVGITDKRVAKGKEQNLERTLRGATLVLDRRFGGLRGGLLAEEEDSFTATSDVSVEAWSSVTFHVKRCTEPCDDADWHEVYRFVLKHGPNGEALEWLSVDHAETEEERSVGNPQLLDQHHSWTRDEAAKLAARLRLPDPVAHALCTAARLHDKGKAARTWQRAFSAPADGVYAKTIGPVRVKLLDHYRHELGSLPDADRDPEVQSMPVDLRDLVLHLIGTHHGYGRPTISASGCDAPPAVMESRVREVALRFLRLQEQWGPWGLAWLEAVLRSADQLASRRNDNRAKAKVA